MPTLLDLQAAMRAELVTLRPGRDDRWSVVISGAGLDSADRLQIHRNHIFSSLTDVLSGIYASVVAMVGEGFFRTLAAHFIEAHPPNEPILHSFGGGFPDFVGGFGPARSLPYLPDLARLEWALHASFHADDELALTAAELAGLSSDKLADPPLRLHSSARIVVSGWPVDELWLAAQPAAVIDPSTIDLDSGGVRLFVLRQAGDVRFWSVSPGELEWLTAIAADSGLAGATAAAVAVEPAFDLERVFSAHLARGSFATISMGES